MSALNQFLDHRCLQHFLAIYDCGNIRRASEVVGLTQPALSKSLSRLEEDLNVLLFIRRNRGLTPTNAAHELYACAKRLEVETRRSLIQIAGYDSGLRGRLRIGAGQMWSWLRMPKVIHHFIPRFPNLEIDLNTAPMENLLEQLKQGQLDLAVGDISEIEIPRGCREYRFPPGIQWPYVSKHHPLTETQNPNLGDLVQYPWIGFVGDNVFTRMTALACDAAGVPLPSMPLKANSLAAIMSVALNGDFVVVIPDEFKEMAEKFGLSRIASDQLKMWSLSTSAVYFEEQHKSEPLRVLIDLMRR